MCKVNDFTEMIGQYRRALADLQKRRDQLGREIGIVRERLAALDEEIDETEEALMFLRRYTEP